MWDADYCRAHFFTNIAVYLQLQGLVLLGLGGTVIAGRCYFGRGEPL
jgi:hypothetical protein